eukprot:3180113-Amphidinium_carterae.1
MVGNIAVLGGVLNRYSFAFAPEAGKMEAGTAVGAGKTSGSCKFGCAVMVEIAANPSGTYGTVGTDTLETYAGAAETGTHPVLLKCS